jgi:ketosteroid isomerase-like protein
MPRDNFELMRRGLDAYNRRDVEAMLELVDPDVEWYAALDVLLGGDETVYRGYDGIRALFATIDETFSELEAEVTEVRDLDDRLVAIGRLRTRGRRSGAETTSDVGWLIEFGDRRVRKVRTFLDSADALEAAGVSE